MATKTIKINGRETAVVNSFSSGPGCEAHTYEIHGGKRVEQCGRLGWILTGHGQGEWIPEISVYGVRVTVER